MTLVSGKFPSLLARGGFVRAVLMLSSAGVVAHGITAVAMPVLSRLYTPGDFGLLTVLSSTLGMLGAAACLRYELAIALPEDEGEADHLLLLSLTVCTVLSFMLAAVVLLVPMGVLRLLGQPGLAPFLWMIPTGLWLAGAYAALQAWHVRRAEFGTLARTRIAQSGGSAGLQIVSGFMGAGPGGLLVGQLSNTGIACLALLGPAVRAARRLQSGVMTSMAATHHRFPIYSTPEALANSAAVYLPVIMIAAYAGAAEAGFLGMAMYVAQAPMSLIGNSISQVFLSKAAHEHREGRLGSFVAEVLAGLVKAGVGPLLALGIVAPQVCAWLFGPGWERTGWLVAWMTPWFMLQFLVVPMSTTLHICGRQRAALILQLGGLALRLGGVWLASVTSLGYASEAYAITGVVFYGAYLMVVLSVAGLPPGRWVRELKASYRVILAWALAGALLNTALHLLASTRTQG